MRQTTIEDFLPSRPDAEEARDRALDRVAENAGDFMEEGLAAVASLSGEYTGEEVREALCRRGITPHHHNAWGALVCSAIRRKLLVPTGRYTRMRSVRSHARSTQILLAVGGGRAP